MKYNQWLDIWLENYVKPTTKIKTYTISKNSNVISKYSKVQPGGLSLRTKK